MLDGPADCSLLSSHYDPQVKWTFSAPAGRAGSAECALVANLTDDNQDGKVDLCDVPDVLVLMREVLVHFGTLHLLSGATGELTESHPAWLWGATCPAVGDLDGNGQNEIVLVEASGRLAAVSADMVELWRSDDPLHAPCFDPACDGTPSSAVAIHDLEGDGTAEILVGTHVYEHDGSLRFKAAISEVTLHTNAPFGPDRVLPTVADLDGDGVLEVLIGNAAYSASGELRWAADVGAVTAYPVDVDADGSVEVLFHGDDGIALVDAQGTPMFGLQTEVTQHLLRRLGTTADLDGDQRPEFGTVGLSAIVAYQLEMAGPSTLWADLPGSPSGTLRASSYPFDKLHEVLGTGSSVVKAVKADGETRFELGMLAGAELDAIVADVDGDASADVIVTHGDFQSPVALTVYEDALKRASPARRIWNQEAYIADAVREDGQLAPHPRTENAMRAQRRRQCSSSAR